MDVAIAGQNWFWEWLYLAVPLWIYGLCVLALFASGRTEFTGNPITFFFRQISDSLQRLTGMPGWSMAGLLTALVMLVIAVTGFYWDVAWHIDNGRDKQLFTTPHVMILVGLGGLVFAAVIAVIFATLDKTRAGVNVAGVQMPWSALLLGTLGAGAIIAFPLDELWHSAYGLDITLWSPTHLQLVGGGSLATVACWLMIAEALPAARPNLLGRAIHVVTGAATLIGLTTFEGEFDFGVPQFQGLFFPLLLVAVAGFTLVFARLALGRGGALLVTVVYIALRAGLSWLVAGPLDHTFPRFPLYLASALAVEAAAVFVGTSRRLKFGLAAGALVGTAGLTGELVWADLSGWIETSPSLLPKVVLIAPLAAVAVAVLAAGLGRAFSTGDDAVPASALVLAGIVLLAAFAFPLPRKTGDVEAVIRLQPEGERALVRIALEPADAAKDAYAFGLMSWQGGGTVRAALDEVAPGHYVADRPVPITRDWKSSVVMYRADEVMAAPVYLPADPEIGASAVPAVPKRREPFRPLTKVLLREAHDGPAWPAILAFSGLGGLVALWVALMIQTARRVPQTRREEPPFIPAAPAPAASGWSESMAGSWNPRPEGRT